MKDKKEPFESLTLPHREVPQLTLSRYRVYKNAKDYVLVEAGNAMEALKTSGLAQATLIERDIFFSNNVLSVQTLEEKSPAASPPAAEPAAAAAPVPEPKQADAAPAQTSPAVAETPLSNDEVNKLLQG